MGELICSECGQPESSCTCPDLMPAGRRIRKDKEHDLISLGVNQSFLARIKEPRAAVCQHCLDVIMVTREDVGSLREDGSDHHILVVLDRGAGCCDAPDYRFKPLSRIVSRNTT